MRWPGEWHSWSASSWKGISTHHIMSPRDRKTPTHHCHPSSSLRPRMECLAMTIPRFLGHAKSNSPQSRLSSCNQERASPMREVPPPCAISSQLPTLILLLQTWLPFLSRKSWMHPHLTKLYPLELIRLLLFLPQIVDYLQLLLLLQASRRLKASSLWDHGRLACPTLPSLALQ